MHRMGIKTVFRCGQYNFFRQVVYNVDANNLQWFNIIYKLHITLNVIVGCGTAPIYIIYVWIMHATYDKAIIFIYVCNNGMVANKTLIRVRIKCDYEHKAHMHIGEIVRAHHERTKGKLKQRLSLWTFYTINLNLINAKNAVCKNEFSFYRTDWKAVCASFSFTRPHFSLLLCFACTM